MKNYFEFSLRRLLVMTAAVLLALAWSGQVRAADELSLQLQKGLLAEEVHRDYNAALKAYQAAVAAYDTNRQAAATAVFRLAETYRKLGKTNEARVQYERVVFEFADQTVLAGAASKQLGIELGKTSVPDLLAAKIPDAKIELYLRNDLRMREAQLAGLKRLNATNLPVALNQLAFDDVLNNLLKTRGELIVSRAIRSREYSPGHPEMVKTDAGLQENQKLLAQHSQVVLQQMEEKVKLLREQLDGGGVAVVNAGIPTRSIPTRSIRMPTPPIEQREPQIPAEEQAEIERLQAMLKNSPDLINAKVEGQQIPLHKAAGLGQTAVAEFLVKNGADINKKSDGMEWTPLFAAAYNGHKGMVELLLKQGADKETMNTQRQTPLIVAASKGYRGVVGEMIGAGVNVNAQDGGGYAALHYAAAAGNYEMTEQLLKAKADTGLKTGDKTWAGRSGENGSTALHLAAKASNPAVVSALLAAGAEVNAQDANGRTPLVQAFSEGNGNLLKRLLDAKADVRVRSLSGYTILHYIKKTTTAELVGQLLQAGAVVNVADDNGTTPLTSAVRTENLGVAKLLLEHGADPNVLPRDGLTPLLTAISLKNADMVRLLLANKAKTELLPGAALWQHPVVMAAKQTEIEVLKALLDHGADLSVTNDKGYTSLHYAVAAMNVPMVELLVKHKADPNAEHPGSGETPMTMAQMGEVIDLDKVGRMAVSAPSPEGIRALRAPLPPAPSSRRPTASEIKAGFEQIVKLLVEHGGDEFFKRRNTITVSRKKSEVKLTWAERDATKVNQFSLFELLTAVYASDLSNLLRFPDLTQLSISRLDGKGVKTIEVNLGSALENGDCAGDIWLEWGDIVEIPEADHNLDERWQGISETIRKTLTKCCSREVTLLVKEQSYQIKLTPGFHYSMNPGVPVQRFLQAMQVQVATNQASFILSEVVFNSRALQSSSDTKRVKVIRKNAVDEKSREMMYDIGAVQKTKNDLRLRDGDVIEVPEKE